jgi:hypothetical protein
MQEKIVELLKAIGLPIALAGVIVSIAFALGLPLEQSFTLFGALIGLPYVIGLIVDLLKLVGVVTPGTSGQWSAALNLVSIIGLAVLLKFIPDFDVVTWDQQLLELAKAVVLIVSWIVKLFATKRAHQVYSQTLGIKSFRFTLNGAH